ncbi:MAG: ABC transporter ATP-binding protein [bacterium]|nr:ABC transporter ATP-binding protein [bacterium]
MRVKRKKAKRDKQPIGATIREHISAIRELALRQAALSLLLMLASSLSEGVAALMLVPVLQALGMDTQGSMGRLQSMAGSVLGRLGREPSLSAALGLYVGAISFKALMGRWQTMTGAALRHGVVSTLRRRLYAAVAGSGWLFFSRRRAADFAHALTAESDRAGIATQQLLTLASNVVMATVYLILALQVSVLTTILALASGLGLLVLVRRKTHTARRKGKELTRAGRSLYAATIEHLRGMKTSKSYGVEDRHISIYSDMVQAVSGTHIGAASALADARCRFEVGSVSVLGAILYISITYLAVSPAGAMMMLFLFSRLIPRFNELQQDYQQYVNMLPAFDEVTAMERQCREAAEPEARGVKMDLAGALAFDGVSFSYDGKREALHDLSMLIKAGETTALVGLSGSGKSTVADLLMGLIPPTAGRIVIDDICLEPERLKAWRRSIGYVAQESFLFADTVRANMLWACPDAGEEDIWLALSRAAVDRVVADLPKGLETHLGDAGVRLSGGERQRLSLARALIRRPTLLILDEATSSLDAENEGHIQDAIEEMHGNTTILMITHRLAAVRQADMIYMLDEGRLIENGRWNDLYSMENGRFRFLCIAQGL